MSQQDTFDVADFLASEDAPPPPPIEQVGAEHDAYDRVRQPIMLPEVAVQVEDEARPGLLSRIGAALGIGRREEPAEAVPTLAAMHVAVPSRESLGAGAIRENARGEAVYDSPLVDRSGKRPTHRISDMLGVLALGQSIDEYEQQVLGRPGSSFGAEAYRTINSLDELEPGVAEAYARLEAAAEAEGHRLRVSETYRPAERQQWLFQQGRTRPGGTATYTLTSDHAHRRALDLLAAGASPDETYEWLQTHAADFGFQTLGSWDPGHIQYNPAMHASAVVHAAARGARPTSFGQQSGHPSMTGQKRGPQAPPSVGTRRAERQTEQNRSRGGR